MLKLNLMKNYSFDDKYSADILGNVYVDMPSKFHRNKISIGDKVKYFINKYGYKEYILSDANKKRKHIQAHRIVASLFIVNPENKPQVNHIDGNKLNNHVSNLEWVTNSENEQHSYTILNKKVWNKGISLPSGKDYRGTIRPVSSFTIEGELVKSYFNPKEAEEDGFNLKQISAVCNGTQKTHKSLVWKYNLNEGKK